MRVMQYIAHWRRVCAQEAHREERPVLHWLALADFEVEVLEALVLLASPVEGLRAGGRKAMRGSGRRHKSPSACSTACTLCSHVLGYSLR